MEFDQWTGNTTPNKEKDRKSSRKLKRPALKLGSWNVWTMTNGLAPNLQMIGDICKTAVNNDKLKRLHVDIASLQEMLLSGLGTLKEKDNTFLWHGKSPKDSGDWG